MKFWIEKLEDGRFGVCTKAADGIVDVLADFASKIEAANELALCIESERTNGSDYIAQYAYACGYQN